MTYSERPWDLANVVLTAIENLYGTETDAGTPQALPALRFVADSPIVAYDCELLAVSLQRLVGASSVAGPAVEAIEPLRCLSWRAAVVRIDIVRCTPNPTLTSGSVTVPNVVAVEASARVLMADAMLITQAVVGAAQAGDLGLGGNVALESWFAVPAQGGMVGGAMNVRIGLI